MGIRKSDNERKSDEAIPVAEESVPARVFVHHLESIDLVSELTKLLHRAFKKVPGQPYTYPAAEQNEKTTREQIERGECWVAVLDERVVGLGIVWPPKMTNHHLWHRPRRVAHLRQIAVEPDFQGMGIGKMLLEVCEQGALQMDATELAGSSPVGARQRSFYAQRGYRTVRYVSWSNTSYDSVVFAKHLGELGRPNSLWLGVEKIRCYFSLVQYKLRTWVCRTIVTML